DLKHDTTAESLANSSGKVLDEKMKHLSLVNAVSSDDMDAVINAIFKINASPSPAGVPPPSYGSPLHLVVSLCQKNVVENVLQVFCSQESAAAVHGKSLDWINVQNSPDRETPLHIAAKLSRLDILEMLFQIPNLNDTLRDAHGNTAQEVATNDRVVEIFEKFITMMTAAMKNAVAFGDHNGLDALFDKNERALSYLRLGWIDINGPLEPDNERSLLHLAAKSDNLELIVWALKYGADPNVTDRKGKKPIDLTKAERVKEILKHAKSHAPIMSASLAQATSQLAVPGTNAASSAKEPPLLKGVLSKWTNYKDGYQPRYFVLEGGVLSYYHDIKDYPTACRGSISTLAADAYFPDTHDLSRFDVSGSGNVKYSLKSRSPADAKKWVWALKESRIWMSDAHKIGGMHSRRSSTDNRGSVTIRPGIEATDFNVLLSPIIDSGPDGAAAHASAENTPADSQHPESPQDLFSFIDQQTSNELHSTEMRRFLVLLKTEMQVQKESVQSAIDLVNQVALLSKDQTITKSLQSLPSLLSDSGQHIEALILGIVRYCNKREVLWDQKLRRANDAHKRLEEIVHRLAGSDAIAELPRSLSHEDTTHHSPKPVPLHYTSSDGEDDDEFYDAQEGSASPGTMKPLPLQKSELASDPELYRESLSEFGSMKIIPSLKLDGESHGADEIGFCTVSELHHSSKGYETLVPMRTKLPLDPSQPKPSLQVWSFLKNAIGKDLSKVTLPVLFNEPISMLQRMCEDIECIELLSLAARVGSKGLSPSKSLPEQPAQDLAKKLKLDYVKLENLGGADASLIRLMLVGAFAMSNYS
ncbi:hypothetical protein HDU91_000897, partial [Kappamyces sp. JEL0680]